MYCLLWILILASSKVPNFQSTLIYVQKFFKQTWDLVFDKIMQLASLIHIESDSGNPKGHTAKKPAQAEYTI